MAAARRQVAGRGKGRGKGGKGRQIPYEEAVAGTVARHLPENAITQAQVKEMLPNGSSVWNNWRGAAWCWHYPPDPRFSTSWADYGHYNAAIKGLQILWREAAAREKKENDVQNFCPIRDLFNVELD